MIIRRYKHIEEYVVVNEHDEDLQPIIFKLPDPPNDNKILNHSLVTNKQVYRRVQIPDRLNALVNRVKKMCLQEPKKYPFIVDEINRELFKYREKYADIHKFIQNEWRRRIEGEWYFINGLRIFVPGKMCFWMDNFQLVGGLPVYRDSDRRYFYMNQMAINDPNCYGTIEIARRREGKSVKAACVLLEEITRKMNAKGGIQSKTDPDAEQFFKEHVVKGLKGLPFYHTPIHGHTSRDPSEKIDLRAQFGQGVSQLELSSSIDFRNAKPLAYDGARLEIYIDDELGKLEIHDAYERWLKVKPTLKDNFGNIIGKSIHTTTVEDSSKDGMEQFEKLFKESNYHNKNELGQTQSGLWGWFKPAYDGLKIDHFGFTDIEAGRKEILAERSNIRANSKNYFEQIRKNPMNLKEAFLISSNKCPFNTEIIAKRIQRFFNGNSYIRRGNFEWENNVPDSRVKFFEKEDGKFFVSYFPDSTLRNLVVQKGKAKHPGNRFQFIAGSDTFNFDKVEGRGSKGGGAVFMLLNPTQEYKMQEIPEGLTQDDLDDYVMRNKTHRFVCTYSHRPESGKAEYIEDMIKMCVFYGCYMFPELNHTHVRDKFMDRGYEGFLLHRYDPTKQKVAMNPGDVTNDNTKDLLFAGFQQYIEEHGMYEFHDELLRECQKVDYESMTHYDRFSAAAYALYGASFLKHSITVEAKKREQRNNQQVSRKWFEESEIVAFDEF